MKIHEFQAKQLFHKFGIPVPQGHECTSAEQVAEAWRALNAPLVVVKAQIHAGGRGKAGGVKLCRSETEAVAAAKALLGKPLITHQTGPQGQIVRRLWIERGSSIAKEFYVAVALDRELGRPVLKIGRAHV